MNASKVVWDSLVADGREVVRTADVAELARRIDKQPANVATALVRSGRLVPLFKGFYHVRGPGDFGIVAPRRGPLDLFALGAEAKGLGPWYFGLETALSLNGMTHEWRAIDIVVNGRVFRPAGVKVGVRRFTVLRWAPHLLQFGLARRGPLRWSAPEKTVLDLVYHDANREASGRGSAGVWREHIDSVDSAKLRRLLRFYPPRVAKAVEL